MPVYCIHMPMRTRLSSINVENIFFTFLFFFTTDTLVLTLTGLTVEHVIPLILMIFLEFKNVSNFICIFSVNFTFLSKKTTNYWVRGGQIFFCFPQIPLEFLQIQTCFCKKRTGCILCMI